MKYPNDINTDALQTFAGKVLADPGHGRAEYAVTSTWAGQTRVVTKTEPFRLGGEVHLRPFEIRADEPPSLLGSDTAPSPAELLFAGINSCMLITFVANAALRGIDLESVSIRTEGALDLRGFLDSASGIPPGFENITLTFEVKGSGTQADYDALLEIVRQTSPNYSTLTRPVALAAQVRKV